MTTHHASNLVDAAWLRAHAEHPDLLILDARIGPAETTAGKTIYASGRKSFEQQGHIPGARFADLTDGFSDPAGDFLFTRPRAAAFAHIAQDIGIHANSLVVAYDSLSGAWAARLWWVLRCFGHAHVRVLDGGLRAWIAAGGDLAFGPEKPPARPGSFVPVEQDGHYVETPRVLQAVQGSHPAHLVCALQHAEFTGANSDHPRRGHIPGSTSLPFRDILNDRGCIDLARVQQHAQRAGLDRAREIILYCGGGINAAGLALALTEAGYTSAKIYDGSLNEWKANPALPLETGPGRLP